MDGTLTRRRILALAAAGGVAAGVAGITDGPGAEPDGGESTGPTTGLDRPGESIRGWPTFGHDAGNTGYAPGERAPTDGIEERWRFDTAGPYAGAPTVDGDTVYVGGTEGYLHAVDASTGDERWRVEMGDVTAAPTVADVATDGSGSPDSSGGDTVFVGSVDGHVYAIDADEGTERWRFETDGEVYSSPAVADLATDGEGSADASGGATVFVGSEDGNVYAIDAASGTERWRFETGGEVYSSPAVADVSTVEGASADASGGTTVFVGSGDDNLYAIDAASGTERWRFETGHVVHSSPTVADAPTGDSPNSPGGSTVFVGSGDSNVYAVDAAEGTERWRFETGAHVNSSPSVADVPAGDSADESGGATVFVGSGDGNVYALDAADGAERWRFETEYGVDSSPVVADVPAGDSAASSGGATVFVGSYDDDLGIEFQIDGGYLHALDAADGTERWRFGTDRAADAATDGGAVFLGSGDGYLYALDAVEGTERWRFEAGGRVTTSPSVVDGTVFVGNDVLDEGVVYALDAAEGSERWRFETDATVDSSPTVVDGTVFVGSDDGFLYALDAGDGTERWHFGTDGRVRSSPVVADLATGDSADPSGEVTVFVGDGGGIYAIDAASGTGRWYFEVDDVSSSPAVAEVPTDGESAEGSGRTTVFVGSSDGYLYALDAAEGTERWRFETGEPVWSSPAVAEVPTDGDSAEESGGATAFVGAEDGTVYAIDAASGTERWRFETGDVVYSSPAVADVPTGSGDSSDGATVFVGSDDESLYALDAAEGTERWRFETDGEVYSSPAVAGSPPDGGGATTPSGGATVFVGSDDENVYAIDAVEGTERWHFETGDVVWSSPAVADGAVYVGSDDGFVYCLDDGGSRSPSTTTTRRSSPSTTTTPGSAGVR